MMRRIEWLLLIVIASFSMAASQDRGSQGNQPDLVPLKFNLERNYTDLQRDAMVMSGDMGIHAARVREGYMTSHLTVRNIGTKTTRLIGWEYILKEPVTGEQVAHYHFEKYERLRPQSKQTLTSAVKLSSDNGQNWDMYKNYKPKRFSESVVISYIEYSDGSVWRP